MPRADRRTALFGTALVVLAALLLAAIRAVSTGSVQTAHMTHEYIPALNADGMMDRAALAELKGAVLVKDIEIAHAESLPQSADGLEQKFVRASRLGAETVRVIPAGSMASMDFVAGRISVTVDAAGVIVRAAYT